MTRKDFSNTNRSELYADEALRKGERLTSTNGEFYFLLDPESHGLSLFKSSDNTLLWIQGQVTGIPGEKWTLRPDGNIAITDWRGTETWSSGTAGKGDHNSILRVQDDGNVVLLTEDGKVVWRTHTGSTLSDRLEAGEILGVGGRLGSPNGKVVFELQQDRNLILKEGDKELWSSGSDTWHDVQLKMFPGGNLVLGRGRDVTTEWESKSGAKRSDATIQNLIEERNANLNAAREEAEQTGDGSRFEELERAMWERRSQGQGEGDENEDLKWETGGDATLLILDNGTTCIRRNGAVMWTTKPNLGSSVKAGESIGPSQGLFSENAGDPYDNGRFQFRYQSDGDFVLFDTKPSRHGEFRELWKSNTKGSAPGRVALEKDGSLVIYDAQNTVQWTSSGGGYDGQDVTFYVHEGGNAAVKVGHQDIWATETAWASRRES